MLFSDSQRSQRPRAYALSSGTTAGALTYLRQQTLPQLITPPQFTPRPQPLTPQPEWVSRVWQQFNRHIVIAGLFAVLVIFAATVLPVWAAFQPESPAAPPAMRSSAGVTGTAATRIEDLGAATFLAELPFLERSNYLIDSTALETAQFVEGARQASLADYLGVLAVQLTLPALDDAIATKQGIDALKASLAATHQHTAVLRNISSISSLAPGTRISSALVTFYACVGNGFCGAMANGQQVFAGAAACSYNLSFGTRFQIANDPTGRTYVCLDRGVPTATWVDIWFYDIADGWAWQTALGNTRSDIIIVE